MASSDSSDSSAPGKEVMSPAAVVPDTGNNPGCPAAMGRQTLHCVPTPDCEGKCLPCPICDGCTAGVPSLFLLCPDKDVQDLYDTSWSNPMGDSGVDIRFPQDVIFPEGKTTAVAMGIRAACFTGGQSTGFWLAPRSSFSKTDQILLLRNHMGIFDRGYRGQVIVKVHNFGPGAYVAKRGASLFQLVEPTMRPPIAVRVDAGHKEFADGATLRGAGGFGSTGGEGQTAAAPTAASK